MTEGTGIYCDHCDKEIMNEEDALYMDFDAIFTFCSEECFLEWDSDRLANLIDYYHEKAKYEKLGL